MAEALNISKIKIGEDEYELKDEWARDNAGKYSPDVDEAKEELKFEEGTSGGGGGSSKVIVKTGEVIVPFQQVDRGAPVTFDDPMPDTNYIVEYEYVSGYQGIVFTANKTANGFGARTSTMNKGSADFTGTFKWTAIHIS